MKSNKIILAWGDTQCIRDALVESLKTNHLWNVTNLKDMIYTPHEGNKELIDLTHQVIERQMGLEYKYIFLTNGATGAINIALRAYKQKGFNTVITLHPPYFPLYPSIINNAELKHGRGSYWPEKGEISFKLSDSPSNPLGIIDDDGWHLSSVPTVWDAVYHNKVYTSGLSTMPAHEVMIGSYSKLLGLNGSRVGWLATNDDLIALRLKDLVTSEYAGISLPSQNVVEKVIKDLNWDMFEYKARFNLCNNYEEWSKLEKFFSGNKVNPIGMFHYSYLDKSFKKLLEKSNIEWMPGSQLGTTDNYGRFNLGASNEDIRKTVKTILKNDRIKK